MKKKAKGCPFIHATTNLDEGNPLIRWSWDQDFPFSVCMHFKTSKRPESNLWGIEVNLAGIEYPRLQGLKSIKSFPSRRKVRGICFLIDLLFTHELIHWASGGIRKPSIGLLLKLAVEQGRIESGIDHLEYSISKEEAKAKILAAGLPRIFDDEDNSVIFVPKNP